MTPSRSDVIASVRAHFPEGSRQRILELLETYGVESYERERERVRLAILTLSAGNEEKLREYLAVAKVDYRDVLAWAESPAESRMDNPRGREQIRALFQGFGLIPYYSQWESPQLAGKILSGELALREDPAWQGSGAGSADEYARWADHICGMACLKMILAARTGEVHPTMHLARIAREYGAYVEEGDAIRGLIYAPFVTMLDERFRIDAEVVTGIAASGIARLLEGTDGQFIASVHPSIRLPDAAPPKKGGHLVLVTSASAGDVTFHNPSGHEKAAQENCRVPVTVFDRYFAGRGVLVKGTAAN